MLKPFPLLNLGRHDLHWTLFIAVLCSSTALILRSSQQDPPVGEHPWKGVVIVLTCVASVGLALLSVVKAWCGYGSIGQRYDEMYEDIEGGESKVPFLQPKAADPAPVAAEEREPPRAVPVAKPVSPQALALYPAKSLPGGGAPGGAGAGAGGGGGGQVKKQPAVAQVVSAPSTARTAQSGAFMTPREEEDISCGIDLEAAGAPFTFNGVSHPKGALRVVRLHKDGVCERQGACVVGDVLVTVDGRSVQGVEIANVNALLTGKAGTSIILGLFTDQSRDPISRHVVLAPSPSSIGLTSRDSSRRSGGSSSGKLRK